MIKYILIAIGLTISVSCTHNQIIPHSIGDEWEYLETHAENASLCLHLKVHQKNMGTQERCFYFRKTYDEADWCSDAFPREKGFERQSSVASLRGGWIVEFEQLDSIKEGNAYIHLNW